MVISAEARSVPLVVVGAGIMGATFALRWREEQPQDELVILEAQRSPALESSGPWHNAGTGHAAYCELNYTPMDEKGHISLEKAVKVHGQWLESLAMWKKWQEEGKLSGDFLQATPHMSFVEGVEGVAFLRARYEAMSKHPYFASMEFTTQEEVIREWAPLLMEGRRAGEPVAATRSLEGKDVDFGRLTQELLSASEAEIHYDSVVKGIKREEDRWLITTSSATYSAEKVFVAAGGATLPLLQQARMKEAKGFGGFPIAGKFWHCSDPEVVGAHEVKVYGRAPAGAPPMSVPHFDARIIEGEGSLLFGPFAGFSTKFLRSGSWLDLFRSLRLHNLLPLLWVAFTNFTLVKYLVSQLVASRRVKTKALREFYPTADPSQWREVIAGQRVQVIKPRGRFRGELQFGTELLVDEAGSLAGLLGASPGASTAVSISEELLEKFKNQKR